MSNKVTPWTSSNVNAHTHTLSTHPSARPTRLDIEITSTWHKAINNRLREREREKFIIMALMRLSRQLIIESNLWHRNTKNIEKNVSSYFFKFIFSFFLSIIRKKRKRRGGCWGEGGGNQRMSHPKHNVPQSRERELSVWRMTKAPSWWCQSPSMFYAFTLITKPHTHTQNSNWAWLINGERESLYVCTHNGLVDQKMRI